MGAKDSPIIFIVDDDASVRRALSRLLRSVGLQALAFASAREFLDQELPARPACLVLDVRMRGMGGLALQRELTVRGSDLPVVIMTGHGNEEIRRRAMDAGAIDVIYKPFDDKLLLDALERAFETTGETH